MAISHIPYMGNTTTSQHGGFPAFALFDDRTTHPAFLKADPTTSSTKFDKFVKVLCSFNVPFFLLGADLGRQWGEDNLKLQMFGHMILGEKNITSAICEVFISMFWRYSRLKATFHFQFRGFKSPRYNVIRLGPNQNLCWRSGEKVRPRPRIRDDVFFAKEVSWDVVTQNSKKTLFFITSLVGKTKSKTPDVEEHVGIWIMFAEFGSFYLQSGFNAPTLWASVAGDSHAYALCSLRPWGIALRCALGLW